MSKETTAETQGAPVKQSLFDMVKQAEAAAETEASEQKADASKAIEPVEQQPETETESTEESQVDTEVESESSGAEQGSSDGSTEASVAHKFLQMLGYDVEGVSEEDLIAEAKRRFESKPEKIEKPRVEPEADIVSATPKAEERAKPETEKQAESKRIAKLYCDPRLEALVEYNKAGKAVAKEDTGDEGAAAAKEINNYMREYRERMHRLGEDPIGFLEEGGLQELIQKEIQAGVERLETARKQKEEEEFKKTLHLTEQQQVDKFFADYDNEIFDVGKDGKPRFIGGEKKLSDFGKSLQSEYEGLRKKYPMALDSVILSDAYERVKKVSLPPKADEPAKTVKEVATEKKKRFLDKRAAPPKQETSSQPVSLAEKSGKVSLRELVLSDPANDDNPAVLELRGSAR